jgi:competence protein ComEC
MAEAINVRVLQGAPARRPIVWVALGLIAGQMAGALPYAPAFAAAAALLPLAFAPWREPRRLWLAIALLAAAGGALQVDGLLRPALGPEHIARRAGQSVELIGRIDSRPTRRRHQGRLPLAVRAVRIGDAWQSAEGRALVTVRQLHQPWQWGDVVQGRVRLRRPRNFGNPGEFDYEAYLARRRIYVTGYAADDRAWERQPREPSPFELLERWRAAVSGALDDTLSGPTRQIAGALLIGESAALAPEIWDRYARTGVVHVLSISGLHVGLVAGAAYALARWLLGRSEWLLLRANVPKLAVAIMTFPVLFYGGIAGFRTPTLRAVVMVLGLALGTVFDRQHDWRAGLAAAALVTSAFWPGSVFDVSFQLSFLSVLSIVLGMERLAQWWERWEERRLLRLRSRRWRYLRSAVLGMGVTFCATLGTAPLTAYHFNRISLITFVANPVVVPLLGLLPVSGGLIAAALLPLAPGTSALILRAVGLLIGIADTVVAALARVPGGSVRTIGLSAFELSLAYGLFAVLFVPSPRGRRLLACGCCLLLAADAGYWYLERWHLGRLRLTFVSVGQGDSTVVEFPDGSVMVVDGGGLSADFDAGERIVGPYLWQRKVTRAEWLVLTHPHFDHFGGLPFLARNFSPNFLWSNGTRGTGTRAASLWETIAAEAISAPEIARGFRTTIAGVEVAALAPAEEDRGSLNDRSLTLRLQYGAASVLLPGDVEVQGELRLLAAVADELPSTVLKVPHHGSRTSSGPRFLDAVAPRIAVISAGYENRFGVPHPEVVARYLERGASLWRTDRDGAVIVELWRDGRVRVRSGRRRTENSKFKGQNAKVKIGRHREERNGKADRPGRSAVGTRRPDHRDRRVAAEDPLASPIDPG